MKLSTTIMMDLTARYNEPHRNYHGISHIEYLFQTAKNNGLRLTDRQAAAIWFHDAIYDPKAKDNEERSAKLAYKYLTGEGWYKSDVDLIVATIRSTISHTQLVSGLDIYTPEDAYDLELVLDLDLSSLALPWEDFSKDTQRIRGEYQHLSDSEWAMGRRGWLDEMLRRDRIYKTEWGQTLEQAARLNLVRALDTLKVY